MSWIIELEDEDGEYVTTISVAAASREQALEDATKMIDRIRDEQDDENIMPVRIYEEDR